METKIDDQPCGVVQEVLDDIIHDIFIDVHPDVSIDASMENDIEHMQTGEPDPQLNINNIYALIDTFKNTQCNYNSDDEYEDKDPVDIKRNYYKQKMEERRLQNERNMENLKAHIIQPLEIMTDSGKIVPPDAPHAVSNSCGPWGTDCLTCCFFLCKVCANNRCCKCACCKSIYDMVKPLYFFILYLFTSEVNSEADIYIDYFNIKIKNDNDEVSTMQVLETIVYVCFELYKTLIGSFLTVFTSQGCGNRTCTIWENIVPKNDLEMTGIILNFLMATTLVVEYVFEIMREAYLIKYLKYDNKIANNGLHISKIYKYAHRSIFLKLMPLYIYYIRFSYVVLLVYIVNVVVSAIIVQRNYYDNTSLFSFVTNALFIVYKIYNVIEVTSYKGDYFYSAYKRKNIHYNTIKPKYIYLDIPPNDPVLHNDNNV
jgi:hypothetical protein